MNQYTYFNIVFETFTKHFLIFLLNAAQIDVTSRNNNTNQVSIFGSDAFDCFVQYFGVIARATLGALHLMYIKSYNKMLTR